jgi:drug/metabolite transporter (DMT)-like permease
LYAIIVGADTLSITKFAGAVVVLSGVYLVTKKYPRFSQKGF